MLARLNTVEAANIDACMSEILSIVLQPHNFYLDTLFFVQGVNAKIYQVTMTVWLDKKDMQVVQMGEEVDSFNFFLPNLTLTFCHLLML